MAESDKIKADDIIQKDLFENTIKSAEELNKSLDNLEKQLIGIAEAQAKIAKNASKEFKNADDVAKVNNALKESSKARDAASKIDKERISLKEKLETLRSREIKETVQLREEIRKENLVLKQNERETNKSLGAYTNLAAKLTRLKREYKDVAAAEGETSKKSKILLKDVRKLDAELKKIDASTGQFGRNVGNYPTLFSNATASLKTFVGGLGIVGGIQLFTRAITDAFNRVRDFDKEIVNLNAILGVTRDEAKDLEDAIIRIAGSSIKTSNEVAKLATELVKLGNSRQEVIDLLKPVNDFAIALNATSEESAEFVGSIVNAFGASSKEVGRFTDVLAKSATRSALDFEKLRDSFTFVAPVARQVGQTVEETAAQLGVLADNGIKSSTSGRLLKTIFATLATDGRTLNDALEEINTSTEKVATATNLFGKEAFGIALVLAENTQRVKELTTEFENSKGSLEELTNKQLESLDSKLKILDSTWESFILGIDRGDSLISKVLIKTIESLTSGIDGLRFSLLSLESQLEESGLEEANKRFDNFIGSFDKAATKAEKLEKVTIALSQAQKSISETAKVVAEDYGALGSSAAELELKYQSFRKVVDISKADFLELRENALTNIETNEELIRLYNEYVESLNKVEQVTEKLNGTNDKYIRDTRELNDLLSLEALKIDQVAEAKERELTATEKLQKALDNELLKRREVNTAVKDGLDAEIEAQDAIIDARLRTNQALSNLARASQSEDEDVQKALLAAQKALAVSDIVINLQKEISSIRTANAEKENREQLNATQIGAARLSAGLGIATVLATQSAYDGVEDTGPGGKADDRGGMLWKLHPKERVMTRKQNMKVGKLSNDELADMAMMYNKGHLINPMTDLALSVTNKQYKQVDNTSKYLIKTNEKLDALINKPVQQVNVDSFGNLVEVVYRNGVKDTKKYKGKNWI